MRGTLAISLKIAGLLLTSCSSIEAINSETNKNLKCTLRGIASVNSCSYILRKQSSLKEFFVDSQSNSVITAQDLERLENFFNQGNLFGLGAPYKYDDYLNDFLQGLNFEPDLCKGKTVVEIGSGFSNFVDVISKDYGANAIATDIIYHPEFSKYDLVLKELDKLALAPERRLGASVTNLPIDDNSVDFVVSRATLLYLPQSARQQALYEILRILKPSGKAFLGNEDNGTLVFLQLQNVAYDVNYTTGGIVFAKSSVKHEKKEKFLMSDFSLKPIKLHHPKAIRSK